MTDETKLGEVCEHGSLKRSCLICELQAMNEKLSKENAALADDLATERGARMAMERELVELRNRIEKLEAVARAAKLLNEREPKIASICGISQTLSALDHIGADCACDDIPHTELLDTAEALLKENAALKAFDWQNKMIDMTARMEKLEAVAQIAVVFREAMLSRYARHNHDNPSECETCLLSGRLAGALAALDHIGETNEMVGEGEEKK